MAIIDILLPKMGESVAEATIIKLLVDAGSSVEADEAVVEIATDKVDSEIPAPEDGVLLEWLVSKDDVVQVGDPIARFEIGGEAVVAPVAPVAETIAVVDSAPAEVSKTSAEPSLSTPNVSDPVSAPERTGASGRFYSPLVRSIAIAEGVGMDELEKISGTGSEGRVTKKDMLAYLSSRVGGSSVSNDPVKEKSSTPSPVIIESSMDAHPSFKSISGGYEVVEMDRMRQLIAKHMVDSVHTSPHVTSFVEADVTSLVLWRNKNKNKFLEKFGEKLTFTPLLAEAIIKAIGDFPGVNASVDGDNVVMHKGIHLGMAAALPSGNLIVPVIKNADSFNLQGLTRAVNDMAKRARAGQLGPDDIAGGTYTMTNVGTFGNVMGTPIINQPQVGILALGAIRKKPAVIETPEGDMIGIRHMMFLSHSYDHRVVDGQLGGRFVRRVADYLENFASDRPIEG
jgi:2-oxoglutarate dehydrogenase E2 component (dihydrolipoamide succinyltransferase)